jgi:Uma2 family endonuclease
MSVYAAKKKATYEDLCTLPENMIGQIVNGELVATPRPSYKHGLSSSTLGGLILGPYQLGSGGGPGGWWIIDEPEVHLGGHVLVPDLAGWRKTRMPELPAGNWTELSPDWVCEVLSSSTVKLDRIEKMPIYAEFGVKHMWLVDPEHKTLEVYGLEKSNWLLVSTHAEGQKVRLEPFVEMALDLSFLWA